MLDESLVRQANTTLVQPRALHHTTMRKQILFGTALMASVTTMAQTPVQEPDTRWSLQAMGAGTMTYRTLLNKDGSEQSGAIIDLLDSKEDPRLGYGAHIMLMRSTKSNWSFGVGLSYSRFGYQSDYEPFEAIALDPNDPAIPNSVRYIDVFEYIGLPLNIQRAWGKRKVHPFVGISISPSYLLAAATIYRYEFADGRTTREKRGNLGEFRTFNLFVGLEAGCAYDASERLQIRVTPYGSLGVLEIIDAPISARLWSAGVQAGVAWRL